MAVPDTLLVFFIRYRYGTSWPPPCDRHGSEGRLRNVGPSRASRVTDPPCSTDSGDLDILVGRSGLGASFWSWRSGSQEKKVFRRLLFRAIEKGGTHFVNVNVFLLTRCCVLLSKQPSRHSLPLSILQFVHCTSVQILWIDIRQRSTMTMPISSTLTALQAPYLLCPMRKGLAIIAVPKDQQWKSMDDPDNLHRVVEGLGI